VVDAGREVSVTEFGGHYVVWRERRVAVLIERYGREWFAGKRILELGCGYGHVSQTLQELGADVVPSEARAEHCEAMRQRGLNPVQFDVEKDLWPFEGRFDLVIHWGVLYHIAPQNFRKALECCAHTDRLCLETEVCNSDDPAKIIGVGEGGFDQALNGTGCRPSPAAVEAALNDSFLNVERVDSSALNAGSHHYDWATDKVPVDHFAGGLRRFWFAENVR
jgi:SAM-dependent methyltransferase